MAPTVGRVVHYYDREEVVNASFQKREPEPYAAFVTRVHKDQDGKPLDVVSLHVLDPEIGTQIKRDVHPGDEGTRGEANRWYWPPIQAQPPTPAPAVESAQQVGGAGDPADDEGDVEADGVATSARSGRSNKKK